MNPVLKQTGKLSLRECDLARKKLKLPDWRKWEDFVLRPAELIAAEEKFLKADFNDSNREKVNIIFGPYFALARAKIGRKTASPAPEPAVTAPEPTVPLPRPTCTGPTLPIKKSGKLSQVELQLAKNKLKLLKWYKWEDFVNRPDELIEAEEKFLKGSFNAVNRQKVYLVFGPYFEAARSYTRKKPTVSVKKTKLPDAKTTLPVPEPTHTGPRRTLPCPDLTRTVSQPALNLTATSEKDQIKIPNFRKKQSVKRKSSLEEKTSLKPSKKKMKLIEKDVFSTERDFDSDFTNNLTQRLKQIWFFFQDE